MPRKEWTDQLEVIVSSFDAFRSKSRHDDCSDVMSEGEAFELSTRALAAIERIGGKASPYHAKAVAINNTTTYEQMKVMQLVGVVKSLLADVVAGYLASVEELIHGELFADFLEMAGHLLDSGYKDPAAVVAGTALESHLRQLATKVGVPIEVVTPKGTAPKKADQINSELVKAGAYSKLDQKNITAWLDLRNKAAHGNYTEYQKEQVALLINGVRDFITRVPA